MFPAASLTGVIIKLAITVSFVSPVVEMYEPDDIVSLNPETKMRPRPDFPVWFAIRCTTALTSSGRLTDDVTVPGVEW